MASGRLDVPYAQPAIDGNGNVVAGARLTFYQTGTTNLADVFADAALTTPVANPQDGIYASNSAGRFTTQTDTFWLDASMAYDVALNFPDGTTLTFEQQYVLGAISNPAGFAPLDSPVFTGNPQAPTPGANDNSGSIATTAWVQEQDYAPLNSPALTGVPTAPTAAAGTSTTQIATTAFVANSIATYALFQNRQPSGTPSGESFTANTWNQRALNSIISNTIAGATLTANQVSLPKGTYEVYADAVCSVNGQVLGQQLRLQNITAATTLVIGTTQKIQQNTGGDPNGLCNILQGVFVLGVTSSVELDSFIITSGGTVAGGYPLSSGVSEVYVNVYLRKIA